MSSMSMCLQTLPSSLMSMYPFWPTPKLFQMPRKYSSSTVKESLFAVILFNSPKMIIRGRMFYHGIIHQNNIILTLPNYVAFVTIGQTFMKNCLIRFLDNTIQIWNSYESLLSVPTSVIEFTVEKLLLQCTTRKLAYVNNILIFVSICAYVLENVENTNTMWLISFSDAIVNSFFHFV